MSTDKCNMVIVDDGNFNYTWECSKCHVEKKATAKFEKSKTCPSCGSQIELWIGVDDEYEFN